MQKDGCTQVTWGNTTRRDSSSSLDELKVLPLYFYSSTDAVDSVITGIPSLDQGWKYE